MSPLVASDGVTPLTKTIVPLTLPMLSLFMDGRETLRHAAALATLRVRLVCRRCQTQGGSHGRQTVVVVDRPVDGTVFVACPHRPAGAVVQMCAPLHLPSLLLTLGWDLACTACDATLAGDNDPASTSWTVSCPCTTREYRYAMA